MYLRGSKWSVSRQRRRSNPLRLFFLLALVAGGLYINQVVVPATPPLFIATPTPTRSPDSYIKDAQDLLATGKINQAIAVYQEAVKADPTNPGLYVTLARWQVLHSDYDGAMENVENALLLNPNMALAKAVRGWILGKQKEFQLANVELEDAITLDRNSPLAWAYLTEMYLDMIAANKGDLNTLEKAIEASKRARDLDPNMLEVRRVRGLVLQNTTEHDAAITEFEAAIALNPNLADLHVALGRSYRFTQRPDRAIDVFLRAISLRPEDPEAYSELAATYFNVGEFARGAQYAADAVKLNPSSGYLHGLLGTMYYRQFQYDLALPSLRLAVRGGYTETGVQVQPMALDPANAASVAYFTRYGISLANLGECGEALQVAQELVQRIPRDEIVASNANLMVETCRQQSE
jgi:tetratricopeptide (TPR) repeat protein